MLTMSYKEEASCRSQTHWGDYLCYLAWEHFVAPPGWQGDLNSGEWQMDEWTTKFEDFHVLIFLLYNAKHEEKTVESLIINRCAETFHWCCIWGMFFKIFILRSNQWSRVPEANTEMSGRWKHIFGLVLFMGFLYCKKILNKTSFLPRNSWSSHS